MNTQHVHRFLTTKVFLVLMACLLLFCSSVHAKYPVTWVPQKIIETMSLGDTKTVSVTLTSTMKLKNANLWVVPALQPFVKNIVPATFETVNANTPYAVVIELFVPRNILPGFYEGTLHFRVGNRTYPRPLKMELTLQNSENVHPVANAGLDRTLYVGDTVTLDGSSSYDLDGDSLGYIWSFISTPEGSAAFLSDPSAVKPTFIMDKFGAYVAQLVVNDGTVNSDPDTVTITTGNSKPVANAGPDRTLYVGDTVTLDGSSSYDLDGDSLSYIWSFISTPEGSAAFLSDPSAVKPTFIMDKFGAYVAQLVVNDGTVNSDPDTVTITTGNSKPVANAGPDQTLYVGDTATLDGSSSKDVDGNSLTYHWSLTARPDGSATAIIDADKANATLVPDVAGIYVVQLIVHDGTDYSDPDTATVTAAAIPEVTVPDVTGLAQPAAEAAITGAGLGVGAITQEHSTTVPAGDVVSQSPVGGTSVPPGSLVSLVVSLGPEMVTVPDVTGMAQGQAQSAITAAGLTVGAITEAASTTVPPGNVISQSPTGGTSVPLGSLVNLVISTGQSTIPPDPSIVAPPVDTTVATAVPKATEFLYSGENPIQTGVIAGTIEFKRGAVLRGKVQLPGGAPLPGVKITILNHPEFGQTLSRADGMFDMAVNGGGLLTINYETAGFLPAQRQVTVPWQDYAWLPDVIMMPLDAQATVVDLTSAAPIQVARGSAVMDSDGARQATLLVPQGTQAQLVMPNGSTQAITTLNIRATEYTVGPDGPKAMPALLPPQSGYTYAVELSAAEALSAGAKGVTFDRPLTYYVENFLGFRVGSIVPVGYYDRDKAAWVASENGRVIEIVSISGDLADVDTNGDGIADNDPTLGVTEAERRQLAILYTAGQSLWRVPIAHFSPWDCNWPYGPPDDATDPNGPEPEGNQDPDDPCYLPGSIIGCENQTLGQVMEVTGTPFSMYYTSSRVPGRKTGSTINILLSGSSVPASLARVELEINVAGQMLKQRFAPAANLNTSFAWDGLDVYGRPVQGSQPTKIRVGFVYQTVYREPAQLAQAFALFGGNITGIRARNEVTIWKEFDRSVVSEWDANTQGLGGWNLNLLHFYDPNGNKLYLGDGDRRSAQSFGSGIITTVAGTGMAGYNGDGGLATNAQLHGPSEVALGPDGSLYIADQHNNRIRRVGQGGIITTVAGTGMAGYSGDGGPATNAQLYYPAGVALGPDGSLYIGEIYNHCVRRVGPDGIIRTVAGTCTGRGYSGDSGPATNARMAYVYGVAVSPDGSLYIADTGNSCVRRVGPDGIIRTAAGICTSGGYSGDGGPATNAHLSRPYGVALGPDGSLYIADYNLNRIRRVGQDGIITTVAGTGTAGYSGDGGPATNAQLTTPIKVALGQDGSLYITEHQGYRVRRVGHDGIITTVAGTGMAGYSGDGGPATNAQLNEPYGVALGPDGSLYIAEGVGQLVRRMSRLLPGASLGDLLIAAGDGSEVYQFSGGGRHLRTLDPLTNAIKYQFTYDSNGRLTAVTDVDGNVTTIQRDSAGNPTAIRAPFGQITTLTLDGNGYLARIVNPAGEAVQLGYTADGLMTSLTDPRGYIHEFSYDALGRLLRDDDPAGGSTSLVRTGTGNNYAVSATTALGRTTNYQVSRLSTGDAQRQIIFPSGVHNDTTTGTNGSTRVTYADGTSQYTLLGPDSRFGMQAPVSTTVTRTMPSGLQLTASGNRTAVLTDPGNPFSLQTLADTRTINGRTYRTTYTAAGRTLLTTTPAGRQATSILDAKGRLARTQIGDLAPVQFAYDANGRLVTATQTSGTETRTTIFTYNSEGYLSTLTDPLGRTASYGYDGAGRPTAQTLPDGRTIGLTYDASGNMTAVTPPGRPSHAFAYTPVDLTSLYTPPDVVAGADHTTNAYDVDKQLTTVTRPDGLTIDFGYDSAGRLNTLTTSNGTVTQTYDPATGNLATIGAPGSINLAYHYDGSLLTGEDWTGPVTGTVGYTYNNNFSVTGVSLNGSPIAYQYDTDNLLTGAGAMTLNRNATNGLLVGTTLGNVADTRSYNGFGEPMNYNAAYSGTSVYNVQFVRDSLGRITQKTEIIGGTTGTTTYGYDTTGRLTDITTGGTSVAHYAYDSNGNRLSVTTGGGTISATYDDQDRLTQYGSATYTYTANGELQAKTVGGQTIGYQYDALGNLLSVTLPGGTQITYLVDGQNRRIGKQVNGTLTRGFLYQGNLRPVAELDGSGTVMSRFVYATHVNVPDYIIREGVTYRIITDHLGSPRLVVDAVTGTIAQRMDYDAFGRVTKDTNPGFQPFGFAGGLYDPDTGLTRFGARDYDAETGRWTAKDPIGFAGGDVNLYGYVRNTPVNITDVQGLSSTYDVNINVGGSGNTAGGYYNLLDYWNDILYKRRKQPWKDAYGMVAERKFEELQTMVEVGGYCTPYGAVTSYAFSQMDERPKDKDKNKSLNQRLLEWLMGVTFLNIISGEAD